MTLYAQKRRPSNSFGIIGFMYCSRYADKAKFYHRGMGLYAFSLLRCSLGALLEPVCFYHGMAVSMYKCQYILDSIQSNEEGLSLWSLPTPFAFYSFDIAGPVVTIALFLRVKHIRMERSRDIHKVMLWMLVSVLLFCLIPKKYPRLMLATLITKPVLCCLCSTCILARSCLYLANHLFLVPIHPQQIQHISDPERCPQSWIRPPFAYDFGLNRITRVALNNPDKAIIYVPPPPIPCHLQTTHDMVYHLEIYLDDMG